jgi:DNA-binding transcriptional LysR family regulator
MDQTKISPPRGISMKETTQSSAGADAQSQVNVQASPAQKAGSDMKSDYASLSAEMLSLTLDQLRTLVMIRRTGSPRKAATALGRDQSSVLKQLDSLNRDFKKICGEPLAAKQERGQDYSFTATCELVASLSEQLLSHWDEQFQRRRSEVGQRLIIATTTFTLGILREIWDEVSTKIAKRAEVRVEHIRTKDFWEELRNRRVDLVIGGLVAERGQPPETRDNDFLEWQRDDFCLITNIPRRTFPDDSISREDLRLYRLILPGAGIIRDAVHEWYGDDEHRLNLEPPSLDVHYTLGLLRSRIVEGFMFSTKAIAQTEGLTDLDGDRRQVKKALKSSSDVLRVVTLGPGFKPLQIVSGLHGRKGERELYEKLDKKHPIAVFWRVFEQHATDRHKKAR